MLLTQVPLEHRPPLDFRRHIASLDGLRGLAISLVFLHHFYPRERFNPLSLVASAGWTGVDLFFVLSGFLITGILYDTLAFPRSLRTFFARRSLRIFPVYLLMVALVVVFARPLQVPLGWRDIPFFAYGANLTRVLQIDPEFGPYLRFWHLWSLAVEEQFYLLWAPLVFLLARRGRIMGACCVGIAAAILLRG
ncbi:MAG TPA: acyltransferase, partial [Acidobacteriaceae bacterium]